MAKTNSTRAASGARLNIDKMACDLRYVRAMISGARAIACCPLHESEKDAAHLLLHADNLLYDWQERLEQEGGAA